MRGRCVLPAPALVCSPSLDPAIGREHEHFIFRTLRGDYLDQKAEENAIPHAICTQAKKIGPDSGAFSFL